MKLSSVLAGLTGVVALGSLAGCGPLAPDAKGGVQFKYALIIADGVGGPIAAANCDTADVAKIKYNIGNDDNGDGVLDATEAVTQLENACNQNDDNGDGLLVEAELGTFDSGLNIDPDTYGAFSVEFLDDANNNVLWRTVGDPLLPPPLPAEVFTFLGDTTIIDQQSLGIIFQGDANQTLAGELQAFIGI
jgi:hypothetical protein